MRGGLLCQAGRSNDLHKASGLDLRQPHGAQAVGLVWRGESGDINQRALKGATKYKRHDIVKSLDAEVIGPLRSPIRFLLAFPRPHEVSDLCALGLPQVKAAGLAVVFDLTAHTFYRVSLVQVIRPARLT